MVEKSSIISKKKMPYMIFCTSFSKQFSNKYEYQIFFFIRFFSAHIIDYEQSKSKILNTYILIPNDSSYFSPTHFRNLP